MICRFILCRVLKPCDAGGAGSDRVAHPPAELDREHWRWLTPGRVSFINPETGQPARSNRIGSVLFIWRTSRVLRRGQIALWDWRRE